MFHSEAMELEIAPGSLLLWPVGRDSNAFCYQLPKTDSEIEQLLRECSLDQLQDAHEMEIETAREHTPHFAHERCNTFS